MKTTSILLAVVFLSSCAATRVGTTAFCDSSNDLQKQNSAELQRLVREDQANRNGSYDSINWDKVKAQDRSRRIAVAKIFAEGCLKSASDYTAAALIFQHGTTPDHYFQAFLWASQAVKLGDKSQGMLAANGVDRYLIAKGHKQLFGTQLSKDRSSARFCVQPVEASFPESRRIQGLGWGFEKHVAFVLKALGATQSLEETVECKERLRPSPVGTVPGFW